MKKLLSLLSVLTISGTAMPNVIAVAPNIQKEENNFSEELVNKKEQLFSNSYIEKFTNIESNTRNIAVDSKDNIYFSLNDGLFVLKQGSTTPTKINGINSEVKSIVIFNDDLYIIVSDKSYYYNSYESNLYVLKQGETTANIINGININETVISLNIYNNNLYIGTNNPSINNSEIVNYLYVGPKKYNAYVLKQGETTLTEINFKSFSAKNTLQQIGVDKKNDIYFVTDKGIDVLRNGTDEVQTFKQIDRNITSLKIDSEDNIYFATDINTFVIKQGEIPTTKIFRINGNKDILIDNNDNIYFIKNNSIYLLLKNKIVSLTPTVKKIDTLENISIWNSFIDKINNNIYFATSEGPYIFKIK